MESHLSAMRSQLEFLRSSRYGSNRVSVSVWQRVDDRSNSTLAVNRDVQRICESGCTLGAPISLMKGAAQSDTIFFRNDRLCPHFRRRRYRFAKYAINLSYMGAGRNRLSGAEGCSECARRKNIGTKSQYLRIWQWLNCKYSLR